MKGAGSFFCTTGVILNGAWRSEGSVFLNNENIRILRNAIHEQLLLAEKSLPIINGFIVHCPCTAAAGYGELRVIKSQQLSPSKTDSFNRRTINDS